MSSTRTRSGNKQQQKRKETISAFREAVNMTPKQIETWLNTEESQSVGSTKGGKRKESVGHESGRRIIEILRKKQADYTDEDLKHMRKVTGYVHRHLAQGPEGDVEKTPWRYSLMNWGHDPLK